MFLTLDKTFILISGLSKNVCFEAFSESVIILSYMYVHVIFSHFMKVTNFVRGICVSRPVTEFWAWLPYGIFVFLRLHLLYNVLLTEIWDILWQLIEFCCPSLICSTVCEKARFTDRRTNGWWRTTDTRVTPVSWSEAKIIITIFMGATVGFPRQINMVANT